MCVCEGFVKAPKERSGSTERSTKRREIFFKKERSIDRKNCKKTRKKNKRFSFAETDALWTEKKNNCLLSNSSFLIFSVTNL